MVHFPGFARAQLWIHWAVRRFYLRGFPHSEIPGSMPACGSPRLIAACHVLHRLLLPRHPSNALESLDRSSFLFMHGEDCAAIRRSRHTRPRPRTNALDNVEVHPASQPTALARTDEPSIHDVIEP